MSSTKELVKFLSILFSVAVLGFCAHLFILQLFGKAIFSNYIVWAYAANTLVAGAILTFLLKAPEKLRNSLGFLFMGGSFLKFTMFFVAFLPMYKADGELDKYEFSTFFVPYALCLIVETTLLINKLNRA